MTRFCSFVLVQPYHLRASQVYFRHMQARARELDSAAMMKHWTFRYRRFFTTPALFVFYGLGLVVSLVVATIVFFSSSSIDPQAVLADNSYSFANGHCDLFNMYIFVVAQALVLIFWCLTLVFLLWRLRDAYNIAVRPR